MEGKSTEKVKFVKKGKKVSYALKSQCKLRKRKTYNRMTHMYTMYAKNKLL